ncbi:MAG: 16S rRNA (guanine(966)-N(2))-methyltransferase RsmD [Helicobacteraceae bacterium 4484_230]|nr:MAG: 16S rRNA (guanine(966)-N(2))-methyltransferase RsmD [Helicobacteraceae bacterium 4484_230]
MKHRNNLTKKIIAGRFKGKTLKLPSKETTRSSKAIVLESFFNTLQFDIVDAVFVEVFSGSGSIGLEALSRGASKVIFMENDREAQKILRGNIALTDPSKCELVPGDSFVNIFQVVSRLEKMNERAFFYIDPPFSIREGHEEIYDHMIELISSLEQSVVRMIAIEHMTGLELPDELGPYRIKKCKKFGKTSLSYFE